MLETAFADFEHDPLDVHCLQSPSLPSPPFLLTGTTGIAVHDTNSLSDEFGPNDRAPRLFS